MRASRLLRSGVRVALASAACLCVSCAGVSGDVHGADGPGGNWMLRPNRCKVGDLTAAWGGARLVAVAPKVADLYYAGANASDTEVVVNGEGAPVVLVRIPGKGKLVALHKSDCEVLDVSTGYTSYTVNDEAGVTGRARFDCRRPEIGHVVGEVEFTCF